VREASELLHLLVHVVVFRARQHTDMCVSSSCIDTTFLSAQGHHGAWTATVIQATAVTGSSAYRYALFGREVVR